MLLYYSGRKVGLTLLSSGIKYPKTGPLVLTFNIIDRDLLDDG